MAARKSTKPDPAPLVGAGLGGVAYAAHVEAIGQKSAPSFDELPHDTAAAWCAVGQAVIAATIARKD